MPQAETCCYKRTEGKNQLSGPRGSLAESPLIFPGNTEIQNNGDRTNSIVTTKI